MKRYANWYYVSLEQMFGTMSVISKCAWYVPKRDNDYILTSLDMARSSVAEHFLTVGYFQNRLAHVHIIIILQIPALGVDIATIAILFLTIRRRHTS